MESTAASDPRSIDWTSIARALRDGDRFVLTTHVRPDTDGIGSEIALHRHLRLSGKDVRIINPGPLQPNLALLDPDQAVEAFRPEHAEYMRGATVIVLDVSERERLGPLAEPIEHCAQSICIDHHINKTRRFANINAIDPLAPATGALVVAALRHMGATIDPVMAQALYATIIADTGSFRFSNTTSHVMRLAADLIDLGADPQLISRAVLATYSRPKLALLASTLGAVRFECDERLSWCAVSRAMLSKAEAREQDTDGLVEYLRLPEQVRVAVFFLELEADRVKISFRSEAGINVNQLALRWGGGGHRYASGAVLHGKLSAVVDEVIGGARGLFDDHAANPHQGPAARMV